MTRATLRRQAVHGLTWLLLALLAGCGSETKHAPLPAGSTVIVLGDSISAGHGLQPELAWPVLLGDTTGWHVINAGISGDTSEQGLQRLPSLLTEHRPKAVILELGGNDMLRRVPDATVMTNLTRMIEQVRSAGAVPILMATPRPSIAGAVFSNLADATFYATAAKEQEITLIDQVLSDVLSEPALKHDQLHPNADGQQRVAQGVVAKLRQAGYLR